LLPTPASRVIALLAKFDAEITAHGTGGERRTLYNHIPTYMVHNTGMRIGELATRADVNIQTLRFYEREGLLRPPARTVSGYRSYTDSDLEQVRFIRLCQGLGFSLREIQHLLILHKNVTEYRGTVKMKPSAVREIVTMANERLELIDEKLMALNSMRADLTALVAALISDSSGSCPVSTNPRKKTSNRA
jgi:DNA-binding transcriptional MerR regulator